jgi:hypothetical protein
VIDQLEDDGLAARFHEARTAGLYIDFC